MQTPLLPSERRSGIGKLLFNKLLIRQPELAIEPANSKQQPPIQMQLTRNLSPSLPIKLTSKQLAIDRKMALRRPSLKCRYSSVVVIVCTIIILNQFTACQTTATHHSKQLTKCEQEKLQQKQLQQQRQQRQFIHNNQQQNKPPVSLPLTSGHEQPAEHEEFSLSSQLGANQNSALNYNNYTLLANELNGNNATASSSTVVPTSTAKNLVADQLPANTTPALPNDSISSPAMQQAPATTTSSTVNSKGPASFGGQQLATTQVPAETTTKPVNEQPAARQPQLSRSLAAAGSDQSDQQPQQPFQRQSAAQPLSSSPSSISIITPLIGPPTQQQATHTTSVSTSIGGQNGQNQADSQSMIKPLFVLGNPISERDYDNPSPANYEQQLQQQQVNQFNYQQQLLHQQQQQNQASDEAKAAEGNPFNAPQQQQVKAANPKSLDGHPPMPTGRSEKIPNEPLNQIDLMNSQSINGSYLNSDRMSGPPLVYSDGQLASASNVANKQLVGDQTVNATLNQAALTPRLFQQSSSGAGNNAAVLGNNPRRPSLPPTVNQANAASGFRSPMSPSGPLIGAGSIMQHPSSSLLQAPANNLPPAQQQPNFYQSSPPYAGGSNSAPSSVALMNSQQSLGYNKQAFVAPNQPQHAIQAIPTPSPGSTVAGSSSYSGRRPLNITRVEHISAECSNDLIRAVIVFNGTFKGIIYSSGYVNDPTCLYVNGTGLTRYEFSIRLNQCGTLGRQELHQPTLPGEARRRDQVMWNTLSIQYNSIIEQEWDEHFRVSCEYGSDFWKTVSFSPFNVETNTGSPVVFTINPPQCQMDVLLGHGIGPKIAVDGPVTVGDPLTLLIHMKSEKAGYDILVKNCFAHNGGKQRMQLIDTNGCVVNERFISPFRGTYNDNDLRHVTLYAYLKAFRFTGSPVLYLECEIHMCQSACPPQMCYWRRLSKRSIDNNEFDYEYTTNSSNSRPTKHKHGDDQEELEQLQQQQPVISDSLNLFKALQVRHESSSQHQQGDSTRPSKGARRAAGFMRNVYAEDDEASLICYGHLEVFLFLTLLLGLLLIVIIIAIVCCLRVRTLTRNQFKHNRMMSGSSISSLASPSLSPSLLSINETFSPLANQKQRQQLFSAQFAAIRNGSQATNHYNSNSRHQH